MMQAALTRKKTPGPTATPPPAVPPARLPVSYRANTVKVVVVAAIWAMPLLVPSGPGNTAPADMFLGLAILTPALGSASRGPVMRLPHVGPYGLSILARRLSPALPQ